jgi:hypothetical protein
MITSHDDDDDYSDRDRLIIRGSVVKRLKIIDIIQRLLLY